MPVHRLLNGDCLELLKAGKSDSVHAIVTDPPYGLSDKQPDMHEVLQHWLEGSDYEHRGGGFMGKTWDSFVPGPAVWAECYRVLKPGGHMLVFAGSRTVDLMGLSLRLAGFEIRDQIQWLYGQGFPKSHNVGKAIDKLLGTAAEREVVGERSGDLANGPHNLMAGADRVTRDVTRAASDEAREWEGWGTALKPAHEPIILVRKPLSKPGARPGTTKRATVAENVMIHGVGALNIDATRVATTDDLNGGAYSAGGRTSDGYVGDVEGDASGMFREGKGRIEGGYVQPEGRHPSNVILDPIAAHMLDRQSGHLKSGDGTTKQRSAKPGMVGLGNQSSTFGQESRPEGTPMVTYGDEGGASRFFYCPKAARGERDAGLEGREATFAPTMSDGIGGREHNPEAPGALVKNVHPTVKPIPLMRYLARMICPEGGVLLDPYMGSGTTGIAALLEGFNFIGMEQDAGYLEIAKARIEHWTAS